MVGIQPYFSTSDASIKGTGENTLFLHERSTAQALARVLPTNLSVAANFSNTPHGLFSRLDEFLPKNVRREDMGTLTTRQPWLSQDSQIHAVTEVFNTARVVAAQVSLALSKHATGRHGSSYETKLIGLREFIARDASVRSNELDILDWRAVPELPVRISPASSQVKLNGNKTYLLAGMSGDLGQSVCNWMITRGAKNVVLTSRSPKVDSTWIAEMARLGARVVIETM